MNRHDRKLVVSSSSYCRTSTRMRSLQAWWRRTPDELARPWPYRSISSADTAPSSQSIGVGSRSRRLVQCHGTGARLHISSI